MFRRFVLCALLMCAVCFASFGQASALRDYVGIISQTFHPDVVKFMQEFRDELNKRNYASAARSVDVYLKGETGTGFVYVAGDGKNYVLTNFHVISHAHTLSITFEKPDGERTRFSELSIIAADEDMDIALLAFAGGQKPFKEGLAFLNRPLGEGDDVYSAGFPGLGTSMVWQLGRGMVSNASVRIPMDDGTDKVFGPFIQHTAQIDPGNSGGPLLVQTAGVPTGFAVAGINTAKARFRQAANFSIPLDRVRAFLNAGLNPQARDELARLNERVASFIGGLGVPKAVYSHIAEFLSVAITGENAEYALDILFEKASKTVRDNIMQTFVNSPVDGMAYAVAWTIEDVLRSGSARINITLNSVTAIDSGRYTVSFNVNNKTIDSEWVNEYGIWQIRKFGDVAAGNKSLLETRERQRQERAASEKLVSEPSQRWAASFAYPIDLGPALGVDFSFRLFKYMGVGFQGFIGKDFFQVGPFLRVNVPIPVGSAVAFIPFIDAGVGLMFLSGMKSSDPYDVSLFDFETAMGFSIKGGLMFTMAAVPGLYLQAAYQRNFFDKFLGDSGNGKPLYPDVLIVGLGYGFK